MKTNGFGHPSWNKWIFVRTLKYSFLKIFTSNSSYGCEPFLLIFIDWNILWSKIEYIINAQFTLSLFDNVNILWISYSPSLFTHTAILMQLVFVLLWATFCGWDMLIILKSFIKNDFDIYCSLATGL